MSVNLSFFDIPPTTNAPVPLVNAMEPERDKQERVETAPPGPAERLPGLHISVMELVDAIQRAKKSARETAREFIVTIQRASGCDDVSEAVRRLGRGEWRPSLQDLVDAGLCFRALHAISRGRVHVKLPSGVKFQPLTHDLPRAIERMHALKPQEQQAMVDAVAKIEAVIPGALVMEWAAPLDERPWSTQRKRDGLDPRY